MKSIIFVAALFTQNLALANDYLISEAQQPSNFSAPFEIMASGLEATSRTILNLLKWNENPQDPPKPTLDYNREMLFGRWIIPNDDKPCVDVRNRVLIRDSAVPPQMRVKNNCKVETGEWYDPYTDQKYVRADEVQIDHVVPLKDAFTSGAWRWNNQARCTYFNYMGYNDHLKVVNSRENLKKQAENPSTYLPPNSNYRCEYLKTWLSIKLIWKLAMQRSEALGIKQILADANCDSQGFVFSSKELKIQREKIQLAMQYCTDEPFTAARP